MQLEARKYLFGIKEAAELASQFTAGQEFSHYQNDPMMRLAVERALAMVGEDLAQLSRVDNSVAGKITDSRSIIAFRNLLILAFNQVDDRVVWGIVQSKMPLLIREVTELMKEPDFS